MKKLYILIFAVLFFVPSMMHAALFHSGEDYSLSTDTIYDENVYVVSEKSAFSGTINGDLLSASGESLFSGNVQGDVMMAGGSVTSIGTIVGDLRLIGGDINLSSSVSSDTIVVGGDVLVTQDAQLEGDVVLIGGSVKTEGTISKDLTIMAGDVILGGRIEGDVDVRTKDSVIILENTHIVGDLVYHSHSEPTIPASVQIEGDVKQEAGKMGRFSRAEGLGVLGALFLAQILVLIVSALILVHFLKRSSEELLSNVRQSFGKTALYGFGAVILMPITGLVLLATGIGSILGVILLMIFVLMLIISFVYAGVVLGSMIWGMSGQSIKESLNWKSIVVGVFLMSVLMFIPILGWVIRCLIMLAAFGSLILVIKRMLKRQR